MTILTYNSSIIIISRSTGCCYYGLARWEALAATGYAAGHDGHRALRTALGQALMRTAEIYHSSDAELSGGGGGSLSKGGPHQRELQMFAEGLSLISDCFPPTSEEVVRARLRLAALHALHASHNTTRKRGGGTSSSTGGNSGASYWEQTQSANVSKQQLQQQVQHPQPPLAAPLVTARTMVQDVVSVLQQADVRGGRQSAQ